MSLVKRVLAFAIKKNFIYLISAFFILLGCLLLMNGPAMATGSVFGKTVLLLGVIQLYELLLALVGYSVYKRMGIDHDGLMLALISILLLFDPTFFNNRVYMCAESLSIGFAVNLLLFCLALFKVWVLVEHTKIPFTSRFAKTLIGTAAYIYLVPTVMHSCPEAYRPLLHFLLLAAVPLVPIALSRPRYEGKCSDRPWSNLHYRFEKYAFFLPLCILPLHLFELGMIYNLSSNISFVPWLLFAIGAVAMKMGGDFFRSSWIHVSLVWSACAFASHMSGTSSYLILGEALTPLRIILVTGALYMLFSWSHTSEESCLWHASLLSVLVSAGGTTSSIVHSITHLEPLFVFVLFLQFLTRSLLEDEAANHFGSALTGSLFICRLAPLTTAMSAYLFIQLFGSICLYVFHREEEDIAKTISSVLCFFLVGVTSYYSLNGLGPSWLLTTILHLQIVACHLLWLGQGVTWARATAVCGSCRFYAYPFISGQGSFMVGLLEQYSGFLSIGLAFALLLVGFYVSVNKERILATIDASE